MKKDGIRLRNLFYERPLALMELADWIETKGEIGVSIKDIEKKYNVCEHTAVKIKNALQKEFPRKIKQIARAHNKKFLYIAKKEKPMKPVIQTSPKKEKIISLLKLGESNGYPSLTDKQLMIAYYGEYTTKDSNDRMTLSEIKQVIKDLPSQYTKHIKSNN